MPPPELAPLSGGRLCCTSYTFFSRVIHIIPPSRAQGLVANYSPAFWHRSQGCKNPAFTLAPHLFSKSKHDFHTRISGIIQRAQSSWGRGKKKKKKERLKQKYWLKVWVFQRKISLLLFIHCSGGIHTWINESSCFQPFPKAIWREIASEPQLSLSYHFGNTSCRLSPQL